MCDDEEGDVGNETDTNSVLSIVALSNVDGKIVVNLLFVKIL